MAKGQDLKPEQIDTLLRQINVLTTRSKILASACKEVGKVKQSYNHLRASMIWLSVNLQRFM
jgi:hypothetical protein